jgi:hypothetical protein
MPSNSRKSGNKLSFVKVYNLYKYTEFMQKSKRPGLLGKAQKPITENKK